MSINTANKNTASAVAHASADADTLTEQWMSDIVGTSAIEGVHFDRDESALILSVVNGSVDIEKAVAMAKGKYTKE